MERYVREAARKVLGLSAGRPMPGETPLQEMGLDSLMALELRNVLAQALGRPLSATLLFDYPTIRGLAGYLLGLVVAPEVEVVEDRKAAVLETDAELAAMSDAEAEELLLAELDGKGGA
jgi:acyl carrier protein